MPRPLPALFCLSLLGPTPLLAQAPQADKVNQARAAVAKAEQEFGPNDVRTAAALTQLGKQLLRTSQILDARQTMERAVTIAAAGSDALVEAGARLTLAAVLLELQENAAGLDQAERALSLRRANLPPGHVDIAEALNAAGSLRVAMGDLAQGRAWFEEASAIYAGAAGMEMRVAMLQSNLAALASRENDFDSAIRFCEKAVAIATKARGAEDRTTLQLANNLGRALLCIGQFDRARLVLEPVLQAQRKLLGEESLRSYETDVVLVGIRMASMPATAVVDDTKRLAELAAKIFGPEHPKTVAQLRLHAEALHRAGHSEQALALVERLQAIRGMSASESRWVEVLRARLLADLGRHDEACALVDRLLPDIDAMSDDNLVRLHERTTFAQVLAQAGRDREATSLLDESLQNEALDVAWTVPLIRWRSLLAELHQGLGERANAAKLDAESLQSLAVAMASTLPSLLESERLRQKQELHHCLDRLMLVTAEEPTACSPRTLLTAILAWKSQVAHDLERDLAWVRRTERGPDQQVRDRLQQVQRTLGDQLQAGQIEGEQWAALTHEREVLLKSLSRGAASPSAAIDLDAIAATLGPTDALVEFLVWHKGDAAQLSAFVQRRTGEPRRIELGPMAMIHQALDTHLRVLARRTKPLDPASRTIAEAAGQRLRRLLFDPLATTIAGCQRLFLATDERLSLLPFDSLPGPAPGTFLLETFELFHLRCGRDLIPTLRTSGHGLLVVDGGATDLPGAKREAASIASLWRSSSEEPVSERHADDVQSLAAAVQGFEFLHIASHGSFLRQNGGAASAADGSTVTINGRTLSASELTFFDLSQCRLAVLSACETAVGEALAGEQVVGMRRALRLAGAQTSLTALWRIDDDATHDFMVAFWRELLACHDPAKALRQAKLSALATARQTADDPLPGVWAAFLLDGS